MMQCSPTFVVVYISLLTMTAGFVLTLSSWFAPPINSFVHSVRVIGPATLIAGIVFMLLSCLICAVRQGKCCTLCYYFILKDKFGPQYAEDPDTPPPLHQPEGETFPLKWKPQPQKIVADDLVSVSSCKLGKNRIVSSGEKDKWKTLRAASLTELGKTSSPRKKLKGYRQLLEEDTMSMSDSHLAGACTYTNGGKPSLHVGVLNKQQFSKQQKPTTKVSAASGTPQRELLLFGSGDNELTSDVDQESDSFSAHESSKHCFTSVDSVKPASEHYSPQNKTVAYYQDEARALTSLGNVSQCMCNCGETLLSHMGQPVGTRGTSSTQHSCQDINNVVHHLGSGPLTIQSSTIDDLCQFPGLKTTHLK